MRYPMRTAAAAALLSLAGLGPAQAAAPDEACTTGYNPARTWVGKALAQSFTPDRDEVARFDLKLHFRRVFSGRITAELVAHLPTEAATQPFTLAGPVLARSSASVAASAGATTWVSFALSQPLPTAAVDAPSLAIQLRASSADPAWGWAVCKSAYARGRGFARPDPVLAGTTIPNAVLNVDGSADLQFRVFGG